MARADPSGHRIEVRKVALLEFAALPERLEHDLVRVELAIHRHREGERRLKQATIEGVLLQGALSHDQDYSTE